MQLDTLAALGHDAMKLLNSITQKANTWFLSLTEEKEPSLPSSTTSSNGISTSAPCTEDSPQESREYPENFEPIRSRCLVDLQTPCTPIMKNPFVSPLLAPDNLLKGLPPVHLVVRCDNGAYKSVNCWNCYYTALLVLLRPLLWMPCWMIQWCLPKSWGIWISQWHSVWLRTSLMAFWA